MAPTIASLRPCAVYHLDAYTDLNSNFAFKTYDCQYGDTDVLTPLDCLAANLLDLRLRQQDVIPLFQPVGPAAELRRAMQDVLDATTADTPNFADLASIDETPFDLVRIANKASEVVLEWTAVTVCKVLHRLRPRLVRVYDSVVRRFYVAQSSPGIFFERFHHDLRSNREWLTELARARHTPDDRELSILRAADIIIWHHQHEGGCGTDR
jgi:hypothetical protein